MRKLWLAILLLSGVKLAWAQEPTAQPKSEAIADVQDAVDDLETQVKALKKTADASKPGDSKFLLTGYGTGGYSQLLNGDKGSTFDASFNPIFLWRPSERVFFEGELEFEFEEDNLMFSLEYAHPTVVVNDHLVLSLGRYLSPINVFAERFHPAWINKLPSAPLAFGHDGLLGSTEMGVQARGAFALGTTRLGYAIELSNGPQLNTGTGDEPKEAGALGWEDLADHNRNKAVGGRIGFLPIPELEIGAAAQGSRVGPDGTPFADTRALIAVADMSYFSHLKPLAGTVDVKAQWVLSQVGRAEYVLPVPEGSGAAPETVSFTNKRSGGYAQLAYRPIDSGVAVLKDFEVVGRFDRLLGPKDAPEEIDTKRVSAGLDYWITQSSVIKVAFDRTEGAEGGLERQVESQFSIGF